MQFAGKPGRSNPVYRLGPKSGCWEVVCHDDFLEQLDFMSCMKPINNVLIYFIQYLSIGFILDVQGNVSTEVRKTHYVSAGEAGRRVVGFLDFVVDDFLEGPK